MFQNMKIKEINYFREALKHIHFDTWFILDLDQTVMKPRNKDDFGGDAWFEGLFSHITNKKIDLTIAKSSLMSVYNAVQHYVRTSAVEPTIVKIIKTLQDIGIPVIGLTSRGYSIKDQTVRQLVDMGVDFSRNSIVADDDNLSCYRGIIFCDGKDKGEKLSAVLSKLEKLWHLPHHVEMLDDKKKHLERVMTALETLKIDFSGLHYKHLDEKVKQFNMEAANILLAHLWKWLSVTVQEDIKKLKLLSEELLDTLDPLKYAESFFHPNKDTVDPVTSKSNLNNPSQVRQPTLLKRSMSAPSFFYKDYQTNSTSSKSKDVEVDEYSDTINLQKSSTTMSIQPNQESSNNDELNPVKKQKTDEHTNSNKFFQQEMNLQQLPENDAHQVGKKRKK